MHHDAIEETRHDNGRIESVFSSKHCARCSKRGQCPTKLHINGNRVLTTKLESIILEQRRRYCNTEQFQQRYNIRAGIEATNSELKRRHGLGKLRVRGLTRVRLALHLKAAACNIKRMVNYAQNSPKQTIATT